MKKVLFCYSCKIITVVFCSFHSQEVFCRRPFHFIYLFRVFDLFIAVSLNSLVIKGLWFPLTLFIFNGTCLSRTLLKVSVNFENMSLLFLYISPFKSSWSSSCKNEDSLNVLYFLYCIVFVESLKKDRKNESMSLWWSFRSVSKLPIFKKLGQFVSNISIDVPVVFLKHVFQL